MALHTPCPTCSGQSLPARGLKGSAFIGNKLRVAAGSLREHGATVHVGVVVPSLVIPHNLEGLAVFHNLGGQASQAHHPGEEQSRRMESHPYLSQPLLPSSE